MEKFLLVLQGVPGSGKSTVALTLSQLTGAVICSADQYFYRLGLGEYKFERNRLGEAHSYCHDKAEACLKEGLSVIIDNTNILQKHAQVYFDLAKKSNATIGVIRCHGQFESVHGVPEETVNRMRDQMEDLSWE